MLNILAIYIDLNIKEEKQDETWKESKHLIIKVLVSNCVKNVSYLLSLDAQSSRGLQMITLTNLVHNIYKQLNNSSTLGAFA